MLVEKKSNIQDLTKRHTGADGRPQYAVFLPAISSFYSTYVGRQRHEQYVDPARMPAKIPDMEQLNFLNDQKGLFHYRWGLYSAGHADLDLTKFNPKEDMIRNRDPNTIILGDSGGFQIAKGVWEGDWKNPADKKSHTRREAVLKWLDGISDYAMTLDIPTWLIHDKEAAAKTGIKTYEQAVATTHFNNQYFIKNRLGWQNGGTKFLNVLQGSKHDEADFWYEEMKQYCDPAQYPDRHFNGWAMGGQNMCDVHLVLRRIVTLIHDGLLQEGVHDWMHFLGTSKLEWACLLTDIQRAVRKYHNPAFTISFDCASPFLATANGQIYIHNECENREKWVYRMEPTADDKKYSQDSRSFRDAVLQDGIHQVFDDSPVSERLTISDICKYGPGDLNKLGKEGRTSWDSFSYALMMGHNVWHHINAVQTANERYDAGDKPFMLAGRKDDKFDFTNIVEHIFSQNDRQKSLNLIQYYESTLDLIIGTRGFTGKRLYQSMYNNFFEEVSTDTELDENDTELLDQLEASI
jgi:hypothetical protein